jgi:phosphoribosyl 1,2-cyclic phosphate phosphodiesterase
MDLKFLGTSAGEQYPGIWCNCENCSKARSLGGKNIRRNSCLLIDKNTLIDLPYEIVSQTRDFNVDLTAVENLLVTHSHKDHFHPYILLWRYSKDNEATLKDKKLGPRFSPLPQLNVYGNKEVCRLVAEELPGEIKDYALTLNEIHPFEEFEMEGKKIVPVLANHSAGKDETPLNFIISDESSTIFYGLDSGWFLPESYEFIKNFKFDMVIVESTFGLASIDRQHFDFEKVKKAAELFQDDALLKENGFIMATHLSPHHSPLHDEAEAYFENENVEVAFDGMERKI